MAVLLLLAIAALALGFGWGMEEAWLVYAALAASVLAALTTVARLVAAGRSAGPEPTPEESTPGPSPEEVAEPPGSDPAPADGAVEESERIAPAADPLLDGEVVFLPRRSTFHRPECSAVLDRAVARGQRSDLEASGMTACRRCLADAH
ncbi:hypothetical protein [Nocardioides daejeonensis]|uniref:hypothetical protein n=1 Tax=Nocardioides daejeonensis TaxID=1046556 RepID=UPI000D746EB6|nr:hypothetical protein [Nocardioides daejeonensis]